jgi:hypothetical protein
MRHDWILEVLTDLQRYAQANDLPALADKAEEVLQVARREIAAPPLARSADFGPDFRFERKAKPN